MTFSWAFITVTYNNAAELTTFWSGPRPADVEWIVIDNASADGSAGVARGLGATVHELSSNVGFGRANNVALRETSAEYIAFVNPDVRVDWTTLPALQAHLQRSGGLAGPQLLYDDPLGTPQANGRNWPYLSSKLRHRGLLPASASDEYSFVAEEGQVRAAVWLMGAAVAARRSVFLELGGWDERFFIYYEDHDLGIQARLKGLPVELLGDLRWTHAWKRATTLRLNKSYWFELQNGYRFYRKYPWLLSRATARRHLNRVGFN